MPQPSREGGLLSDSTAAAAAPRRGLWLHSIPFSRVAAYVATVLVIGPFFYHFAHLSTAYLGLLEDDYFYYVTVADKFVTLGKLTYDGTTLTNGFHPLWFGVLVLVRLACGGLGPSFYITLALIFVATALLTYELGRRFAQSLGASPPLAAALAALYAVGNARLAATGMECAIGVPLFTWWLLEVARPAPVTPRRAAALGFIASLAILARLDVAIAVALAIVGYLILVRPRGLASAWRLLVAFAVGGVLVPVYAAANYLYFDTPLPVSALAKRLVVKSGFSFAYARAVAFETYLGPTIAVVLPLGAIALYLLLRRNTTRRPGAPRPEALFSGGVALLFAFVFFFLNALSGWIFFGWYAYPLPAATLAAMVFICKCWTPTTERRKTAAIFALLVLVVLAPLDGLRYYRQHGPQWSISDNTLLAASYELEKRLRSRDGLFAMGAVAGVAAYVAAKPVVQLEGIVTDRRLVEHVRHQDHLGEVLREYHADYLIITFVGVKPDRHGDCYLVTQPDAEWAGKRTAKMRGELCSQPVEHFLTQAGTNSWSIFPWVETLVWDLRQAQWTPPLMADANN